MDQHKSNTSSAGEPGVETDTGQMKIGNGVSPWNTLPYVGAGGDVFDHALVRNIGMHAYINDFTASYTFDNVYNTLTFYITIFGNGVYYDMNFSYSPSLNHEQLQLFFHKYFKLQ